MAKNKTISQLLGEASTVPSPEAVQQDVETPEAAGALQPGESPSVELLMSIWDQGEKEAVAIRVLDSLDSYQQFVELLFRIGEQGAIELGGIMDELTSEEKSPHQHDVIPTRELATKYGKHPKAGPDTHAAVGESTASKIIGKP